MSAWSKSMLAIVLLLSTLTVFGQPNLTWGSHKVNNFIDDTLILRYKLGTADTSAIFGMSAGHQYGPDMGLWGTIFHKITPDSIDSTSHNSNIFIEEVDYWGGIGDTVYTVIADTSIDTTVTTGVAADTNWVKRAFAPNPANGYRVICSGASGCSSVMTSTLKIWFHIRKKIGTFK